MEALFILSSSININILFFIFKYLLFSALYLFYMYKVLLYDN